MSRRVSVPKSLRMMCRQSICCLLRRAALRRSDYHAPDDRTFGRNAGTLGMLLLWDGVPNEMKEFWPDIRRKVFHRNTP